MEDKQKDTICAVVVTYNRTKLLLECLASLLTQTYPLDAIYIVDNASTDNAPGSLLESGYIQRLPPDNLKEPWETSSTISAPKVSPDGSLTPHPLPIIVHYVRMHENTGGAGGFHEGVKRAYEKGYDWLWLMDDDGKPEKDCLELLRGVAKKHNLYAVAPLVVNVDNPNYLAHALFNRLNRAVKEAESYGELVYISDALNGFLNAFNGFLINRIMIQTLGLPTREFFIWGDDTEYACRIVKSFNVATFTPARFYHPAGRGEHEKVLFGLLGSALKCRDLNFYCRLRNNFLIKDKYQGNTNALNYALRQLIKYAVFSAQKREFKFMRLSAKAFYHAFRNRFGYEKTFLERYTKRSISI